MSRTDSTSLEGTSFCGHKLRHRQNGHRKTNGIGKKRKAKRGGCEDNTSRKNNNEKKTRKNRSEKETKRRNKNKKKKKGKRKNKNERTIGQTKLNSPQSEHVGPEKQHLHCAGVNHLRQEVRLPREEFDDADAVHRLAHHRHAFVPPLNRLLVGHWWLLISDWWLVGCD